jgi:hypothetical protein
VFALDCVSWLAVGLLAVEPALPAVLPVIVGLLDVGLVDVGLLAVELLAPYSSFWLSVPRTSTLWFTYFVQSLAFAVAPAMSINAPEVNEPDVPVVPAVPCSEPVMLPACEPAVVPVCELVPLIDTLVSTNFSPALLAVMLDWLPVCVPAVEPVLPAVLPVIVPAVVPAAVEPAVPPCHEDAFCRQPVTVTFCPRSD